MNSVNKNIIGQFGVGFYSTFMVAEKVEVYSQSYRKSEPAYKWVSDGYVSHLVLYRMGPFFFFYVLFKLSDTKQKWLQERVTTIICV